ncbi:YegS/Rv2252/BmrU family lipid kinase [Clostridium sp.]|uniref:YegS/Rv2252/BmrU family lipid kinase n=1 Tax=Clostridium sp. TaxID=1506 RepID=UPI003F3EF0C7
MKSAILLYNPKAGNRQITTELDYIIKRVQSMGYELRLYRSETQGAIEKYIIDHITNSNTDMIIVSGGDGTINECINGMAKKGLDIPIGILPLGTANDFAHTAGITMTTRGALDIIAQQNIEYVDIGRVNEKYFINVCNMGLFSGVSHIIDLELKKNFGKLAYYIKGIEELHNYQAMDLIITDGETRIEGKYVLVLIFNGKGAGGFNKLAKNASIKDGKFDVVAIKDVGIYDVPLLFLKVLQGEHLEDPNVDYLITSKLKIECNNSRESFVTDIDGEIGPDFPLEVSVIENTFRFYLPYISNTTLLKDKFMDPLNILKKHIGNK